MKFLCWPLVQIICVTSWLILQLTSAAAASPSMALPNCQETCGDFTVPYPFGIGKDCSHNEWFELTCNASSNSTKPYLKKANMELLRIGLGDQSLRLNVPITAVNSKCGGDRQGDNTATWTNTVFRGSPFRISSFGNRFLVIGCGNAILDTSGKIIAGCTSECINSLYVRNSTRCYGIQCCETSIPNDDLAFYNITISGNAQNCTKAFFAENDWYSGNLNINEEEQAPVLMSWRPADGEYRLNYKTPGYNCFIPIPGTVSSYHCNCGWAYEGNPYVPNGCRVVEACADCENECELDQARNLVCRRSYTTEIILGSSLGGGLLLLLLGGFGFILHKYMKRRRIKKLKKKFFMRNGGMLLQQQLSSVEGMIDKTIVFNSLELEKATDNYNKNRIIGQGGQGTVYKGMLTDGKIVAIKKSNKVVNQRQLAPFINELVLLSQIKHRNIVKVLGCCLETEVPLLVYEYIPNGNLYELIQAQDDDLPFSWRMRLQIATEIAGALAYLHSASYMPIYHRDIKSTNILLDDKYRAKVADFGTSRSVALEKTHLTTAVQGTFGYLDPEYFQTSQFTDKSDVYSYGVVLIELLTGQKAVSSTATEEERSLATRFLLYKKEMRFFDLLDSRVKEEAQREDIIAVANIAQRCLSLSGKKRPTMTEVMMELETIRMSHMPISNPNNSHEDQYIMEMKGPTDTSLHSIQSGIVRRVPQSDADPLLVNVV